MQEVINFPKTEENRGAERVEKMHEAVKKLGGYRGDVRSKNVIRQLPNLKVGEVFWVEMDEGAVIVEKIDGNKITIRELNQSASISTGVTIYDMNKKVINQEPLWMPNEEELSAKAEEISAWIKQTANKFYTIYSFEASHVSLIEIENDDVGAGIIAVFAEIGDIVTIDIDVGEQGQQRIDVWLRTGKSDDSVLYILFPYDAGLIKL